MEGDPHYCLIREPTDEVKNYEYLPTRPTRSPRFSLSLNRLHPHIEEIREVKGEWIVLQTPGGQFRKKTLRMKEGFLTSEGYVGWFKLPETEYYFQRRPEGSSTLSHCIFKHVHRYLRKYPDGPPTHLLERGQPGEV